MSELCKKIAKACLDVGGFAPDKTNKDQNYSYISADQVLEKAGQALAKNGVVVMPSVIESQFVSVERQGKSPRIDAVVKFEMVVTDGEGSLTSSWFGCGSDYMTPDKALYKAITSGHKYFLMKLLNIGIGNEDSEHDSDPETSAPKYEKKAPVRISEQTDVSNVVQPLPVMPYAEACAVESSDGTKYGDIATEKLSHMANAITKSLAANGQDAEKHAEHTRKLAAIRVILAARAEQAQA